MAETQALIRSVLETQDPNFSSITPRRDSMTGFPLRHGSITDLRYDGSRFSNPLDDNLHRNENRNNNNNNNNLHLYNQQHSHQHQQVYSSTPFQSQPLNSNAHFNHVFAEDNREHIQISHPSLAVHTNRPFDSKKDSNINNFGIDETLNSFERRFDFLFLVYVIVSTHLCILFSFF